MTWIRRAQIEGVDYNGPSEVMSSPGVNVHEALDQAVSGNIQAALQLVRSDSNTEICSAISIFLKRNPNNRNLQLLAQECDRTGGSVFRRQQIPDRNIFDTSNSVVQNVQEPTTSI